MPPSIAYAWPSMHERKQKYLRKKICKPLRKILAREPVCRIDKLVHTIFLPMALVTDSFHLQETQENGLIIDVSFLCVVKTQKRWSNKIYKTELTKTRYNNQVLGKYRVDPQRAGLTLIVELTWSNLGLKGVLNKRK